MNFKSIKLFPVLLVLGLTTVLGACAGTGDVTAPEGEPTEEGVVEPEGTTEPAEAEQIVTFLTQLRSGTSF